MAALIGAYGGVTLGGITATGNVLGNAQVGNNQPGTLPPSAPPAAPPSAAATTKISTLLDDDPVIGSPDAPVTIVEFTDYQCPFCARHFTNTYGLLKSAYIDTGKVRYVVRDFPLSFHPEAQKGSEATECAREQGKFEEMHDRIFQNQGSMNVAQYKLWAGEFGLNQPQFDTCLDSGKFAQEVADDVNDGAAVGVGGTPSFVIGKSGGDGQLVVGAQPFAVFEGAIEAALAA
ncbi:MAG: DsbA family protein [Candidatus Aenigmarchaeota archaeon]|nr:DsbA family protein [Candidatus Aenigmarchaeota archaeon]